MLKQVSILAESNIKSFLCILRITSMIKNIYTEFTRFLTDIEKKNCPKELYCIGDFDLLIEKRRVSVVGSRKVSKNGIIRTQQVTKLLVEKGFIVVSGLAEGVDSIAHQTAINNNGKTISVVGTPLNKVYPKKNEDLFKEITKNHLAISQFPIGYPFLPSNFPMRNRTMALISDATIIIEASEKSGTKHQGWEALRLGRSLFILESIINDVNLTWPKEMIEYGAQVLTKENFEESLLSIPYLTSKEEELYAF
jgi:DNA processing protein